ncbi:MAG: hypothetical protein ABI112_12830 [Terracoccus sp.]
MVHHGGDDPDDLLLDASGALLYSDYTNGTISRLDPGGSSTVLHRGIDGPEGMVLLPDGSLVVAEENTNRLLVYAPGQARPAVFATLPGRAQKSPATRASTGSPGTQRLTRLSCPTR